MTGLPAACAWALFPLWGACAGSFFNVLIYRMPRGLSVVRPRSFCPACRAPLRAWENVPVLGWLWLRGKCAHCHAPIPARYPLVELLGLALGFLAAFLASPDPASPLFPARSLTLLWLLLSLVPVFASDFKYQLLPDTVTVGGILAGLLFSLLPDGMGLFWSLAGALLAGGGLWLFGAVTRRILGRDTMGFGDCKLLASYGALMGAYPAFVTLLLGAALALLVMVPARLAARRRVGGRIPFGPFLACAAPLSYLWGEKITGLYFGFVDRLFF
jgi:leader peptidase (prepilin peptidase)/N-methyltransferase